MLRSRAAAPSGESNLNNQNNETTLNLGNQNNPSTQTLSPEDVAKLIEQHDAKRVAENNLKLVVDRSKQVFGANYSAELQSRANKLGMSVAELESLAKARPAAFFKLLDIPETSGGSSSVTPPASRVNSAASQTANTARNQKYYSELRTKVGDREFFTPKIQNQMFEDAKALGAAFYN